jgi:prenylcysteine oxidase/farnesylcysteine lyase
MAVEGGNWRIFERMIKSSGADLRLNTAVKSVERHEDGTFTIASRSVTTGVESTEDFDTLILAAPYQYSDLDITPKPRIVPDTIPYVNLHVTLFTSPRYLSSAYFGLPENENVPRMLLTTLQPDERPGADPFYKPRVPFNSISLQGTRFNKHTKEEQYLYKIFSMSPVSDRFLGDILGVKGDVSETDVSWVYRKLWQSYPYEIPRVTFEELRLDENLWYTGGMESFISCMETSALMGKNVAKLVVETWVGQKNATAVVAAKGKPDMLEQVQIEL